LTRDLRKIDESKLPAILVRQSTILVNMLHLRVLITSDHALILHVFQNDAASFDSATIYAFQGGLHVASSKHSNLPYELRVLETILVVAMGELEVKLNELKEPVIHVLEELDGDVSLEKLKQLLDVQKQLNRFQQQVKLVRNAIQTVLEADDDMAAMYLTEKAGGGPRPEHSHEEVEMLLEN
jgi:hypothetical protein